MADWTIDEEMFRERLRTVADSLDAFAVASLLRDASVSLNEHDRQIVRQRAEIERLRAALEDAERHADLRLMEVERLQALIDAFASWEPDAEEALLAAATKDDDDDGR